MLQLPNSVGLLTFTSPNSKKPRTAPLRFIYPPASPPPTSPLPPPPISPSPISSTRSHTPPLRSPRPQCSLPEMCTAILKPAPSMRPESTLGNIEHIDFANEGPQLRSPFTSPAKAPIQLVSPTKPTETISTQSERCSFDSLDQNLVASPHNGRIWWSHAATSTATPGTMAGDQSSDYATPRIPPRSQRRKSNKPPQIAIARSPLHIPPRLAFEAPYMNRLFTTTTETQKPASLMQDEPVTSLPLWPSTTLSDQTPGPSKWGITGEDKEHQSQPLPKTARHLDSTKDQHELPIPGRHISFCAVTNLEELPANKEAPSAGDGDVAVDVVEDTRPQTWHRRYRRQLWIVATVTAVLVATCGILVGVIWRLNRPR